MARLSFVILASLLSGSLVAAAPAADVDPAHVTRNAFFRRDSSAAGLIAMIMPASVSCAAATSECATNVQAAPYFVYAFEKHGLLHPAEIAGVLALSGLETGDLKARTHAGVPGQGTSNMQHVGFNLKYANTFPELVSAAADAAADPNAVLALVTPDKYNFGSGAWFLATQCSDDVRALLQTGTDKGFAAYMACVGVPVADDRLKYWRRAQAAFGLAV